MRQKPFLLEPDILDKSQDSASATQTCQTSIHHRRKASLTSLFSDSLSGSARQSKSGGIRRFARSLWSDVYGSSSNPSNGSRPRSRSQSRSRGRTREVSLEKNSEDVDYEEGYDVQKLKEILWENIYATKEPNNKPTTVMPHHKEHLSSFTRNQGHNAYKSPSNISAKFTSSENLANQTYNNQLPNVHSQKLNQWPSKGLHNSTITNNRRILVLQGIPPNTTPTDILAQINCGPLEKLVWKNTNHLTTLEVYFVFAEHARRFRDYCTTTGFFVVNGVKLDIQWANRNNTEHINHDNSHAPVPKNLLNEIVHGSARRVLICSKPIPNKTPSLSSTMHYPLPQIHLSKDFDIDLIRRDFSQYGDIIDFGPVISKKLCFSIHFADVRSAIVAKNDLQTDGGMMASKYNEWSFWYGKDPTDRPCYVL